MQIGASSIQYVGLSYLAANGMSGILGVWLCLKLLTVCRGGQASWHGRGGHVRVCVCGGGLSGPPLRPFFALSSQAVKDHIFISNALSRVSTGARDSNYAMYSFTIKHTGIIKSNLSYMHT